MEQQETAFKPFNAYRAVVLQVFLGLSELLFTEIEVVRKNVVAAAKWTAFHFRTP